METPEAKRLRLAKQYLEEIKKKSDDEEEDGEQVAKRLKLDYLDSIGKLRKHLADNLVDYDSVNIRVLKHKSHSQSITCLCLSSDDRFLFTGSKNGNVLKWDVGECKPKGSIDCSKYHGDDKKFHSSIFCMALSTDFKFLAISDRSEMIQIWNPETMTHLHIFVGHRDFVTGVTFRKDSHQMFSCSQDRSVKVWSLDEMAYVETL